VATVLTSDDVVHEGTDNTKVETARLASADVPQADDLDKVRAVVVAATDAAMTTADIAASTGFSVRHVEYRMRAALLLGLLKMGAEKYALAPRGKMLLATRQCSERERLAWLRIVEQTPVLATLAPDLFDQLAPTREQLAERIVRSCDMSTSTALRRASALLSWRRRLQSRQLSLFDDV